MVIVEPTEHFKNTTTTRKTTREPHQLIISIPTCLDAWVRQKTDYLTVINKALESDETYDLEIIISAYSTKGDMEFIIDKSEKLGLPRATIVRYLVNRYSSRYMKNDITNDVAVEKRYKQFTKLSKKDYEKIKKSGVDIHQLLHFCIRQYNERDEQELIRYHTRTAIRSTIKPELYKKLRAKTNNMNRLVIHTILDLRSEWEG